MSRYAQKRSFAVCPETCPAVDLAIDQAESSMQKLVAEALHGDFGLELDRLRVKVKEVGTELMREALTGVCSELIDAEERADAAEERVTELERELEELRSQLREAA